MKGFVFFLFLVLLLANLSNAERHRRPCRRLSPPPPSPTPARQVVEDLREEAVEDAQEDAEERQDALIATLFVPGPEGEYYDCVEESDVDADDE